MGIIFLIVAIVLFLVDMVLAIVGTAAPQIGAVLLYGGLASFAASFLPLGPGPWVRP